MASPKKPSKLRMAWTAGRLAGRQILSRGRGEAARDVELGEMLMSQLDEMKGLAMKLGQIVSYMGVPMAEPVLDKLARLQIGERGMSAEDTRAALVAGLGAGPEELFERFDMHPIAAASIGQVHRARFEGEEVAVKIQYLDIAGSFESDLSAVQKIAALAGMASAVDGRAIVEELAKRLEEECDYGREARMQRAFARAFADDRLVLVPAVIDARSSPTILTSRWVDGVGFDDLRRDGSAEDRDRAAAVLIRFSYRSLFRFATIQADPHPGNFIFTPKGPVAFLDFGCVRTFERDFVEQLRGLARSIRDRDRSSFRRACLELGVVGKPKSFDYDHFFTVMEHLHRPLLVPAFRFTEAYMREGYAYNGPTSPNARTLSIPPAYVWVMRLQWGLWSILAKLGAGGSYASVLDEALEGGIEQLAVG